MAPIISSYCAHGGCGVVDIGEHDVRFWDTKDPDTVVVMSHADWRAHVLGIKAGEFDLPV